MSHVCFRIRDNVPIEIQVVARSVTDDDLLAYASHWANQVATLRYAVAPLAI